MNDAFENDKTGMDSVPVDQDASSPPSLEQMIGYPDRAEFLTALLDNVLEGVITVDERQRIVYMNPAAEGMFRCSAAEVHGEPIDRFVPARHRAAHRTDVDAFARGGTTYRRMGGLSLLPAVRFDGSEFPAEITISRTKVAGGSYSTAIVRDVEERESVHRRLREAEKRLQHSQRLEALGMLAGAVAHDFNNLLTVIKGFSALASRKVPPDSHLARDLDETVRAANSAMQLTRKLLTFAQQSESEPDVLDVDAVLSELERTLRHFAGESIRFELSSASGSKHVRIGEVEFEQIVVNLVKNACDAMPLGGLLRISSSLENIDEQPLAVVVRVADTGTGMNEETIGRLFDPYFTTKATGEGTGLGLSTVHGIVRRCGGRIRVESKLDHGSTFEVSFPAYEQEDPGSHAAPAPIAGTATILLVDDEQRLRTLSRTILERAGYAVLEARDGSEAILVADAFREDIDLLVTDVSLPGLSGPRLAELLSDRRPLMSVLYISGFSRPVLAQRALVGEATLLLEKPFTPETLVTAVRGALADPSVPLSGSNA